MFHIKGYILWQRTITLTFPVHELSVLDWSEKWFLTCSSFTIWKIWMKLYRYVDHQRLHIVTKDRHSYLSRLWVIHPWLIWELVFDMSFISSVRAHCFRSITWVFMHRFIFKFCIHIVIGDEWYGIVNGQNTSIFNGVTALFRIGKMVSGLFFLYCSWYLNETSQICWTAKVTYYNEGPSPLPSQFMSYPPLINLENVFDL